MYYKTIKDAFTTPFELESFVNKVVFFQENLDRRWEVGGGKESRGLRCFVDDNLSGKIHL